MTQELTTKSRQDCHYFKVRAIEGSITLYNFSENKYTAGELRPTRYFQGNG